MRSSQSVAIVIGFNLFLLSVCVFAIWRGGLPEQLFGAACLVASAATSLAHLSHPDQFRSLETDILIIDAALLVFMAGVAFKANRFWPTWATAAHSIAVAVHLAKAARPDMDWPVYGLASTCSSLAVLLLIAAGTMRHRLRLKRTGTDPHWRFSSAI